MEDWHCSMCGKKIHTHQKASVMRRCHEIFLLKRLGTSDCWYILRGKMLWSAERRRALCWMSVVSTRTAGCETGGIDTRAFLEEKRKNQMQWVTVGTGGKKRNAGFINRASSTQSARLWFNTIEMSGRGGYQVERNGLGWDHCLSVRGLMKKPVGYL